MQVTCDPMTASPDEAEGILKGELRSGDLLITMGAGDVYRTGEKFLTDK